MAPFRFPRILTMLSSDFYRSSAARSFSRSVLPASAAASSTFTTRALSAVSAAPLVAASPREVYAAKEKDSWTKAFLKDLAAVRVFSRAVSRSRGLACLPHPPSARPPPAPRAPAHHSSARCARSERRGLREHVLEGGRRGKTLTAFHQPPNLARTAARTAHDRAKPQLRCAQGSAACDPHAPVCPELSGCGGCPVPVRVLCPCALCTDTAASLPRAVSPARWPRLRLRRLSASSC